MAVDVASTDAFLRGLTSLRLQTSFDLASITLYLYDFLLVLDLELDVMWRAPWNLLKVVYIVQRVLPLVDTIALLLYFEFKPNADPKICKPLYAVICWLFAAGIGVSEVILTLRVWAVWGRGKMLAWFLAIFYVSCFVPIYVGVHLFNKSVTMTPPLYPGFQGCIPNAGSALSISWGFLILYDAGLLVMMMIPGIRQYKTNGWRGNNALYTAIYTDGAVFYICLCVLAGGNMVMALIPGYLNIMATIARNTHAMLTSRVVLHIRRNYVRTNVTYIPNPAVELELVEDRPY